jgi:gamma-glutamyl-gamma-aminobutyrate hydrolase PuuD
MEIIGRLNNIEKAVKLLNQKCRLLETENNQLITAKKTLEHIIEKQKLEILNLEKQNKITKIAESISQEQNNSFHKEIIDNLVNEIDECLKLIKN